MGVATIGYLMMLATHISPHAAGSDSSGYLSSARLLSRGAFDTPVRALPGHPAMAFGEMTFQPLGFRIQSDGNRMVPIYPIGLPLHLLVASRFVGWHNAAIAVNLLTTLASGGLLWALARQLGLSSLWAGAGVLLLWLCPLFLFSALQPMSDLLALGWSLATLYCALRARNAWPGALACGAALGIAVLVRPTNALLVVPVVVALGFQWRCYLAVGLGGLPGAAAFAFYNWRVYGSPLVTGYGDVSSAFSREFLAHNLTHFAEWIPTLLSPLIMVAVAAPFLPATRQRGYGMLAAWFVTLTGFYAFYYHSGETWWYLRFILPAFPVLILATLAVLAAGAQAAPFRNRPVKAALAGGFLFAVGWQIRQIQRLDVMSFEQDERCYPDAAQWARKNLPANSALFCMQVSGAFYYYSDFVLIRWDQMDPNKTDALFTAITGQQRPVYAALFPFETPEALEKIGGRWTELTKIGQVTFWQRQR